MTQKHYSEFGLDTPYEVIYLRRRYPYKDK